MVSKIFPIYSMTIEGDGGTVTVSLPLSAQINIKKDCMSGQPQQGEFVIYNMARSKRDMIYFDPFYLYAQKSNKTRRIQVTAGYKGYTERIFDGMIWECYSVRVGVNYETHITAMEGGYFLSNAYIQKPLSPTNASGAIKTALFQTKTKEIEDIKMSPELEEKSKTTRVTSEYKSTDEFVLDFVNGTDYTMSWEGRVLHILKFDEVLANSRLVSITADTGLLETPRKNTFKLDLKTIFEPMVKLNQLVSVVSQTEPRFNGTYKVVGYEHKVLCSNEVSSQNISVISVYYNEVFKNI